MKKLSFLLVFLITGLLKAQKLYVPNGTAGIGSSINGNVGIGTTNNPAYPLDVNGTIRSYGNLRTTAVGNDNGYYADDASGSTIFSITRQPYNEARFQSYGYHTFYSGGNAGTEKVRIDANGFVGIGTTLPSSLLHLKNTSSNVINLSFSSAYNGGSIRYTGTSSNIYDQRLAFTMGEGIELFSMLNDGRVGIGTTRPLTKFHVYGNAITSVNSLDASEVLRVTRPGNGGGQQEVSMGIFLSKFEGGDGNSRARVDFRLPNVGSLTTTWGADLAPIKPVLSLLANGRVGIGSINPDAELTVNGTAHVQEVKVDLTIPGPDYVFEPTYHLSPLDSIKTYIDKNKHLPEVPSAKEMEKNGVNLGEMNMLLLKKIEELTLYVIEQNKKIDEINKRDEDLRKEIEYLKNKK
jgi:hypothetical protein